jgi:hypothetical protein
MHMQFCNEAAVLLAAGIGAQMQLHQHAEEAA